MPFVDSLQATKMIRELKKQHGPLLPRAAIACGRVPILAVSASLSNDRGGFFMEIGFDGRLLKLINFRRLGVMLSGALHAEARNLGMYKETEFVQGSWMFRGGVFR